MASTPGGSPVRSKGHSAVTGMARKARLASASCLIASVSSGPVRPGQADSPTQLTLVPA